MERGLDRLAVRAVAEGEGFRQVAEGAASVTYRHEQRHGGCRVEVFLSNRSVMVTMDQVWDGRQDSIILRGVRTAELLSIFRDPGTKIVRRKPNPFFVLYKINNPGARRFFRSADAPIDGTLESISLGCDPSIFFLLYSDGSFAHSGGIPPTLHRRLAGRQGWLPRPELVRLGARSPDCFFLQHVDGAQEWRDLPRHLERLLEAGRPVEEMALGEGEDYYLRLRDGTEAWCLPGRLASLLEGRGAGPGQEVANIALGERGDFFLQLEDGVSHGKVVPEAREALARFELGEAAVELGPAGEFVVIGRRAGMVNGTEEGRPVQPGKRKLEDESSIKGSKKKNTNEKKRAKDESEVEENEDEDSEGYLEVEAGKEAVKDNSEEEMETEAAKSSCTCGRPVGLLLCRSCGEAWPGRVRRACPAHRLVVHSMDVFGCKGCGHQDGDMLEEHPLPAGASKPTNRRVLG
jgi:hypothetical protein